MPETNSKESHFFAHLARMKLIQRWPLMRSVSTENISEHSLQVAFVAHALALIKNKKFGGDLNPERIAILGMYHDTSEVLTGDLPTPLSITTQKSLKNIKRLKPRQNKSYFQCYLKSFVKISNLTSFLTPLTLKMPQW